jgi:hypothetical protein
LWLLPAYGLTHLEQIAIIYAYGENLRNGVQIILRTFSIMLKA